MLLQFNSDGVLAPQDYPISIEKLKDSLLVRGCEDGTPWNYQKRLMLVNNLSILVK
ncbi:MAG: hypothetical protein WA125_09635 [Desulfosporosinus sp.]